MTTHLAAGPARIAGTPIGDGHPTYFIADIGANHDGNLERAKLLVRMCADAGADAAKFQNFRAETIVSANGFAALGAGLGHQAAWREPVVEVYRRASLPSDWTEELREECRRAGIGYLTTPYDLDLVDLVAPYVDAWKIGSGDITWTELIEKVAGQPGVVILATGASTMEDVTRAVEVVRAAGGPLVLMQCNTNYTGDEGNFDHLQLRVLETYAAAFPEVILGLSDHSPGHAAVLGAVTLGARVVEKHFTDDRSRPGPDHGFALDEAGWREMVCRTRELERALGGRAKRVMANEEETAVVQRRALRARRDLPAGRVIAAEDLVPLRPCPAEGLPPYRCAELVGAVLSRAVAEGDLVRLDDVRLAGVRG